MQPEDDYGPGVGGVPYGWYFDAAGINVVPSNSSGTVLVRYYCAAPSMILSSDVANTSQISTYSESPTIGTATYNAGTTLVDGDVISGRPSHHVVVGSALTGVGSANIPLANFTNFDSDRPVPLAGSLTLDVGDWVAPNGRTPFVPLPEELFGALVHRTTGVMLRASGYLEESAAQLQLSDEAEALARDLLAPRSEGTPRALLGGLSRATGRRTWRW